MKKIITLVFALVLALPAFGAISIVQHVANWHGANVGLTVTCALSATGAGHNVIVGTGWVNWYWPATPSIVGVTDNQGNTYTLAPGSRATSFLNFTGTAIFHALNATAGVTSITVTYQYVPSVSPGQILCEAYEVSGSIAFDTAANAGNNAATDLCADTVCLGPVVQTSTTTGVVIGVISMWDHVDQNPTNGSEFTAGGDFSNAYGTGSQFGTTAACSALTSAAAAHQPSWHRQLFTGGGVWPISYSSSTAAYKQ